jgi:hypothetical protein
MKQNEETIEHCRNVELADIQTVQEVMKSQFEEKQKRIEQKKRSEEEQSKIRVKLIGFEYAIFYAKDLVVDSISILERQDYFYDEVEREVIQKFIP